MSASHYDNSSQISAKLIGKNIMLGITGGIAAYKSADLTRRLQEAGADVRIVMTAAATEFVTPLTFHALSGHPVFIDNDDHDETAAMQHIELARWADAIIVAPASANTIAKLAHARADNLLTTTCLASEAIKCFAPAMNKVMWQDPGTQSNCRTLTDKGWLQLGPASGLQACGETGAGRMLEVCDIQKALEQCFESGELQGLNLVITAGPTYEAIDPVRFIGNRSSGRMGYAIAQAAQEAGANITLISGPSQLTPPASLRFISIESAAEMKQAVFDHLSDCNIYISAAAVADYRVAQVAEQKIKKSADSLTLSLVKNEDILSQVAALTEKDPQRPYVVGFAAETEDIIENAREKLQRKNLDMIVANDVSADKNPAAGTPAIGFDSEYNALHVLTAGENSGKNSNEKLFATARKTQLARQLISFIAEQYKQRRLNEKNTA